MNRTITFSPNTSIELVCGENNEFIGLGAVTIDGAALRSTTRPMTVRLDTPTGVLYPHFFIRKVVEQADGSVEVCMCAQGMYWERGEYADDYDQTIVWLSETNEPIEDDFSLIFAPAALALGGKDWNGFSYAFRFHSDTRQLHRMLVHATWEIGGSITGNTVLSQGQCNMPVYYGAKDKLFTTACLRTLDAYGSPQANSFQITPRAGLIQGFDFQFAKQGALLQYWPNYEAVSSLLESPPGSDQLHVVDEYRFTLTNEVTTSPKSVLFLPGELAEHEARDFWWDAYHFVYGGIQQTYGIAPTIAIPEAGLQYSTRIHDGRLRMTVGGVEVDSTEVPYAIAEYVLPKLAANGIKRFFPEVMSESDVTEDGLKCKLQDGMHGDLHCASVCATRRFFPSEFWGGIKAWKVMGDKAHELGIEMGAWFAPHFSPRTPIFAEHPEYRMISVTGLPSGGGYGFQTLVVADWNSGIYDWVLNDLKRWHDEGGLDYLFTDSLSNMGLVQVNYADKMRTNFAALGRLYGDLQKIGIKSFTFECISPFGVGHFGCADLRGDLMEQDHAVAGQNDFGWWVNEEDMAVGIFLGAHPRKRTAEELERIQFRMMANRAYGSFGAASPDPEQNARWMRLNQTYNQALPYMTDRRMLPNRAGVRWLNGDTQLIWAYVDLPVPAGVTVEQLDGNHCSSLSNPAVLPAWGVYRLIGAPVLA